MAAGTAKALQRRCYAQSWQVCCQADLIGGSCCASGLESSSPTPAVGPSLSEAQTNVAQFLYVDVHFKHRTRTQRAIAVLDHEPRLTASKQITDQTVSSIALVWRLSSQRRCAADKSLWAFGRPKTECTQMVVVGLISPLSPTELLKQPTLHSSILSITLCRICMSLLSLQSLAVHQQRQRGC